ncbi:hypothetical protein BC829DRAFT_281183 [Chytridium lagenaria]|nr:hypothetical protein BC829DRAFT_281183 [Chytridium lagenaria]
MKDSASPSGSSATFSSNPTATTAVGPTLLVHTVPSVVTPAPVAMGDRSSLVPSEMGGSSTLMGGGGPEMSPKIDLGPYGMVGVNLDIVAPSSPLVVQPVLPIVESPKEKEPVAPAAPSIRNAPLPTPSASPSLSSVPVPQMYSPSLGAAPFVGSTPAVTPSAGLWGHHL